MKQNQGKSECLGYFNLARGLGMILIIAGHTYNLFCASAQDSRPFSGAGSVLGGGIIAMFFMISGFGFYKRSPRKCFQIQKKLLLWPYTLTGAAVLVTKLLLAIIKRRSFFLHGGELVLTYLLGLNAEGGGMLGRIPIESVSILWFLLALFGGWILYNRIMQLASGKLRMILIGGCVILGYCMTLLSKVWPFCLPMGLQAVGYLAAGDQIRKRNLLEKKLPYPLLVLLIAVSGVSAAFGGVNMVAGIWKLGLFDVAGSFCTGFLLLHLYAAVKNKIRGGKITGMIEEIGFCSIWVVCLHAYEKIIFPWYRLGNIFPDWSWLCAAISLIGRSAVMYFLYRVLNRIRKKWKKKHRKVKLIK